VAPLKLDCGQNVYKPECNNPSFYIAGAAVTLALMRARQAVKDAIRRMGAGDTLIVWKLDRLARSTRDLLNTLAAIAEAGASFRSLGDPWRDTTCAHGKLMVTVLGGLAEFERHLILARTTEGRKRAQARGVKFGRKPKVTPHQQREALERRARGKTLVDIARATQ
jgi:DNA invertase Pin-like site-specific DNA recombinase